MKNLSLPLDEIALPNGGKAERDENTERQALTMPELLELGLRLEALEKPKAKSRQKAGGGKPGSGKLPEPAPQVRDKVASALGISGKTYEKAKAVKAAAEADPVGGSGVPGILPPLGRRSSLTLQPDLRWNQVTRVMLPTGTPTALFPEPL